MKTKAAGRGPVFTTSDCFKETCRERPGQGSEGGTVRAHRRETEISDYGNFLMLDKGVGLNPRNESQRRVHNELIDADSMSVIGRMACLISHDMRHSLSAMRMPRASSATIRVRVRGGAIHPCGALRSRKVPSFLQRATVFRRGRFARSIMTAQVMSGRGDGVV